MISIMEQKGLVKRDGGLKSAYRAKIKLTDEGKNVAKAITERAALAVELAGKGLTDENRDVFYSSLEIIMNNLRDISKKGLPEE